MNLLEQHALGLLNRDPLAEAERIIADRDQAVRLGMHIAQDLGKEKEDLFQVLGDTYSLMPYVDAVRLIERNGFEKIYTETHGPRADLYEVWWRNDGLLLTTESYTFDDLSKTTVNMIQVYYNWHPKNANVVYAVRSSGGFLPYGLGIWAGHYDGREGLFTHIKQLKENGDLIVHWVEPPFLWFLNYTDTKDKNYDYKAINRLKFSVFPGHVQKHVGLAG